MFKFGVNFGVGVMASGKSMKKEILSNVVYCYVYNFNFNFPKFYILESVNRFQIKIAHFFHHELFYRIHSRRVDIHIHRNFSFSISMASFLFYFFYFEAMFDMITL